MSRSTVVIGIVIGLVAPLSVGAAYFSTANTVAPAEEVVDDIYAAGQRIDIRHGVQGDVYAIGDSVSVAGSVTGDVVVGGNLVSIAGIIGDDVFAGGDIVELSFERADDVFAVGQFVTLSDASRVDGDVYVGGQNIVLAGQVAGSVRARGAEITITSSATIEGDLITYGDQKPTIEEGATIKGTVEHRVAKFPGREPGARDYILRWVRSVVSWFVAALVLLYLLPRFTAVVVGVAQRRAGASLGLGVLWLALVVPILALLAVTIVGLPLVLVIIFMTGTVVAAGIIYSHLILGTWVMRRLTKQTSQVLTWQHAIVGAFVLKMISLIPVIGWVVVVVLSVLAIGAVLLALNSKLRVSGSSKTT